MPSAPFSTAARAHSQSPAGASSSGKPVGVAEIGVAEAGDVKLLLTSKEHNLSFEAAPDNPKREALQSPIGQGALAESATPPVVSARRPHQRLRDYNHSAPFDDAGKSKLVIAPTRGRNVAITMPPTITARNTIMIGSRSEVRALVALLTSSS